MTTRHYALLFAILVLALVGGAIAQEPTNTQNSVDKQAQQVAIVRLLAAIPAEDSSGTTTKKRDNKAELDKLKPLISQIDGLDTATLREILRTLGSIAVAIQVATPKVTFYQDIGFAGRNGSRTSNDGHLQREGALHDVEISSLITVGNGWFWFWSDDDLRGSVLAVEGAQMVPNLHVIPKINSFPFGLGNGHWGDEIHGVQFVPHPPTCGHVTMQPGNPTSSVDGITIIHLGGRVETCN
jgi:hypothetical protein